ncbi:major capsid protein [Castellaniella sp.]|uniref:major capsid protein n=1 Tax=Castellaniella sp. TaxID=1955812 RepID=UPI002AFDF700|nr:hypothetical protein [Castellaniella sp.]
MPLLKVEADKLSNNTLLSGLIEEVFYSDDLFRILPFVKVNSKAYVYNREVEATEGQDPQFVDPNDTIVEGAAKFKEVTTRLRILAGDVDVDKFLDETESDTNNQLATQVSQKAKRVAKIFRDAVINGDSATNAKEFDGLTRLTENADANLDQTISAGVNGAPMTLSILDELLDTVPQGANVLMMRKGTMRAFRTLMRAAGGNTAADLMVEAFGRPMLTHNGVPIIANDFLPKDEVQGSATNTCSIYALRVNEADGLHGLYGGSAAGMRVENIGTVQNKDATRIRVKWYAGMALKSTRSIARLKGIVNV